VQKFSKQYPDEHVEPDNMLVALAPHDVSSHDTIQPVGGVDVEFSKLGLFNN
jgi:hypothetical protein